MECESVGTFLGCVGDGIALPYRWRGALLCRGCIQRDMDPKPSKKTVAPQR